MLAFQLAHARARDAVAQPLDVDALLRALGPGTLAVESQAPDRAAYLRDPRLGRSLARANPPLEPGDHDLAVVVADGLSARAAQTHAVPVLRALEARLPGWRLAPITVARLARVAIGDEIGFALRARAVLVLIGERPGLSASDSLGAYLTWDPRPGRRDSERNCVSNIHGAGLGPEEAAVALSWLLLEAQRLGLTGVGLKDRRVGSDRIDAPAGIAPPLGTV